jgi:hypothetical protein
MPLNLIRMYILMIVALFQIRFLVATTPSVAYLFASTTLHVAQLDGMRLV